MEAPRVKLARNPRQNAGLLSILTFWWTAGMFRKGYTNTFDIGDLYAPLETDRANQLGDRLEKHWNRQLSKNKQNPKYRLSLVRAIFRTFWKEWILLSVITIFSEIVLRLITPIMLGRLLLYFRQQSEISHQEAIYYATVMVTLRTLIVIIDNQYGIITCMNGVRTKIAVCSLLYRKSLRLSRNALGDTSPGKVVNLMSNDVNRFDIAAYLVCFMWSSPIVMLISTILLWYEVGWAGVIGMLAIVFVTPIQSYTGKLTSRYRLRTALKTDERIRLMDEIISGIAVIKMYAWEIPFTKLISYARKLELKVVLKSGYLRAVYMTFQLFTTRLSLFCVMIAFVLLGEEITAAKVFLAASYLSNVAYTMAGLFGRGIAELGEGLVATRRLQRFLEYEEVQAENGGKSKKRSNGLNVSTDQLPETEKLLQEELPTDVAISLRSVTARWVPVDPEDNDQAKRPATLMNLNIDFGRGKLVGIVGPVGAGKSSILQAILKELPLEHGNILTHASLAYVSQESWMFAGSIRQNILFGETMDEHRYRSVLKVCALLPDLVLFPDGDETIIGERGVSLSGGQKARICLARAVYRKADVYLLDDPLSAVDAHVAKHLFDLCLGNGGYLNRHEATRILVTHQVHFLHSADWVIVMKDGKVEAQGTPLELQKRGIQLEQTETDEDREETPYTRQSSYSSVASSIASHVEDSNQETSNKHAKQSFEQSSEGTIPGSVFMHYWRSAGNLLIFAGLLMLFLATQLIVSAADYWISFWVAREETWSYGDMSNATVIEQQTTFTINRDLCAYIQFALVVSIFGFGLTRAFGFYKACARASQGIHDSAFRGFISTRMRFFDTNPSGRILNRFSKDMGAMDELLPKSFLDATQTMLMFSGAMLVVLFVQPLFSIPILALLALLLLARRVYLRTSQNTRRLEGITRSPIFTHIGATLTGLPTIRSFGVQKLLIDEFDSHQNINTGACFMFHSGRMAFGLILDTLFVLFLAIVTFSYLLVDQDEVGATVGLAVTQITSIGSQLQFGIRQSAEMFNHLIAVERLLEYQQLPAEPEPATKLDGDEVEIRPCQYDVLHYGARRVRQEKEEKPSLDDWPSTGSIEFQRVSYHYYEGAPLVLKSLTFCIESREKIGIVGRTGAGKSSIIGALFRMANVEGSIKIDGIDTGKVQLQRLRSHISIIPQDPVLFSGTLRKNLDPFETYPDEELWKALELVELKTSIGDTPSGLLSPVSAGGQNFSVGQRQLLCLARAILRKNRILVLDEATANVDPDTDRLIQETIRSRFTECTVLTIAHRLNTIMDYDRILVMSEGKAVEFGKPLDLLQQKDGVFTEIVLATGPSESENLMKLAQNGVRQWT